MNDQQPVDPSDLEYTPILAPSPVVTPAQEVEALRSALAAATQRAEAAEAQLAAATQRAEAAEAQLAAVPVGALRTVILKAWEVVWANPKHADVQAVKAWLAQQSEVQP